MRTHFYQYDKAALYAAKMRAEGYYSEVLNEHSGLLWGEGALGFVVLSSDAPVDDVDDELAARDTENVGILTYVTFAFFVASVLAASFAALLFTLKMCEEVFRHFLRYPFESVCTLVILPVIAWLVVKSISSMYNAYRDKKHAGHTFSKSIVTFLTAILIFVVLFFV